MNKNNSKMREFQNFTNLSQEWWNPNGKFKILHQILPLRMKYILDNINRENISDYQILDLGCGGGLTCEPLARLGANITGIDFIKGNIEVAKNHSKKSNLQIKYLNKDIEVIKFDKKYDLILLLEIIEHLDNWENLIEKLRNVLNPKGKIIISTINKTLLSKIFAINFAENILKWVPKNTHDFKKLVKPEDLKKVLNKNNFRIKNIMGMNYNPIFNNWQLSKHNYLINYFCTAEKN